MTGSIIPLARPGLVRPEIMLLRGASPSSSMQPVETSPGSGLQASSQNPGWTTPSQSEAASARRVFIGFSRPLSVYDTRPLDRLSKPRMNTTAPASRRTAFLLLALATLFWAGNWVLGRALRDVFEPAALPGVRANIAVIRRSAGLLLALSFFGVALFQWMIYEGLKTTTAVNAVLINSSFPAFMLLCSWAIERERGTRRQIVGMLISLGGILVIMAHGDPASLVRLEFHTGDALILVAMPVWGVYSVLLKRRPPELDGIAFLFVISLVGTVLILPAFALEA